MIEISELDRLYNTRNAILYGFPSILASSIEGSLNKGFYDHCRRYDCPAGNADPFCGQRSGVWIPLLVLMNEEVDCRLSSLLDQFFSTLILGRTGLSRSSGAQSLGLEQGLEFCAKKRGWTILKLYQRHTHRSASTFLYPASNSIHDNPD